MAAKDLKNKGVSKKVQGEQAKPRSLSDTSQKKMPRTLERGMGSEFANAVGSVLDQSKNMKGSKSSFLGVEKQTLDPKEHAHSLVKKK